MLATKPWTAGSHLTTLHRPGSAAPGCSHLPQQHLLRSPMVLLRPWELLLILLLLQGMDSYQSDSLAPLKRTKRAWIITTIDVEEEDKGPFPKYAGQLFNNRSYNTSLKYLISGPGVDEAPEVGLFSLEDDANGHVYVHRSIDRERTPDFQIRFDVGNRESGELLDRSIFFKIKVKDINDNAPEFSMEEYSTTIRESHSKDEPVIRVTALDKDEGGTVNSQVSYSIHVQVPSPDGLTFSIDPATGSIFLSGCLDCQIANSFSLLIKASDHGSPQLSSTATVTVAVEDANNHLPVFTSDNYPLQISAGEEHPAVLRLQVEDKDSPHTPAWRAKYKITKGNEKEQFTIETDPATNEGILSVIKPLSYEGDSEMRLVISVANEEPFFWCTNGIVVISDLESTNTAVNIKVLQSQRVPKFHPPVLTVQKEDSMKPGRVFRKYPATYPDAVPNKIKYELAHDPDGWLSVDENSGVLTVAKEFDQESPFLNNSLYTIIVHATDHGKPPQTGTGTILLYLSDIHDHMPALVAPALEVCHKKEGTPLIIAAKSALAHPHSGPLTFELAEGSEDVKHNWTLGRNFGQSVELVMLRSLPQGSYLVPIIIQDKQGFSTRQNQHIRLCLCPDGHTCKYSSVQAAVGLGSGAIVIILMTFFLLLVSSILLCQCYRSGAKSKAIAPPQEGEQTLINYNEESRSSFSEAGLDITHSATLTPVSGEAGKGVMAENGCVTGYKTSQARQLDCFIRTVDRTLAQKVFYQSTLEDYGDICEPCRYTEEGEPEPSSSPCSISISSEHIPDDFLNTLGPMFSALEEICQK
ncbi:cadherin-like protein 26 isoform X2 [Prinia subflava]|uniref:cadherin-like protein 26 isoform X2 n=1 Tax=Prinia subflava TaxID=208062 RepID=UPI002FE2DAF5